MFPKKGNIFPTSQGAANSASASLDAVAEALKAEVGTTHQAIKIVAKWTGANERTVKTWFAAQNAPGLHHLIPLLRNSDSVLTTVLVLAKRQPVLGKVNLVIAREVLFESLQVIDSILNE